jgi:hypothetical protein
VHPSNREVNLDVKTLIRRDPHTLHGLLVYLLDFHFHGARGWEEGDHPDECAPCYTRTRRTARPVVENITLIFHRQDERTEGGAGRERRRLTKEQEIPSVDEVLHIGRDQVVRFPHQIARTARLIANLLAAVGPRSFLFLLALEG